MKYSNHLIAGELAFCPFPTRFSKPLCFWIFNNSGLCGKLKIAWERVSPCFPLNKMTLTLSQTANVKTLPN